MNCAKDIVKGGGLKRAEETLRGVSALVVGLAGTGVAACRFLKKCGAFVTGTDSKNEAQIPEAKALKEMGISIKAGGHKEIDTKAYGLVVVSPGVPYDIPFLQELCASGADVISDIELAYRYIDAPVLAIAGTNGKTTTTTLLGQILEDAGKKVFVGGNIGTPAVELVENAIEADFCVLEISSFHLETTKSFNAHVGILLNITEDHLDRYRDFDHYAETKFRLFENQTEQDYAVVNVNDPVIAEKVKKGLGKGKVVPFTVEGELDEGLSFNGHEIIFKYRGKEERYPVKAFRLKGLHNIENIMSVIAAARLAGVEKETLMKTLDSFEGLHHRMEFVRELSGVTYIDDSKGTNIGALMMALRGFSGNIILIAGGVDKGGDYRVLSEPVKDKVKLLILLGEARFKMKEALGALTETVLVDTFQDSVALAHKRAASGDTVLLCPACSSFDMFKNYKERGERFKALVGAL